MADIPARSRRLITATATTLAVAAVLLVAGCGSATPDPNTPAPLLLAAPRTDIIVTIPPGWHQVINSANPGIGEMVAPTTCMGDAEVSCSTALARIASLIAPTAEAADQAIYQAITSGPGITPGPTTAQGPATVGAHTNGYIHRFSFSNPGATLTAAIAAVPSGPPAPDATGNREFSLVLAWVSNKPGAPQPAVIDEIINSAKIAIRAPAPAPKN
jgi:hypothetical protein